MMIAFFGGIVFSMIWLAALNLLKGLDLDRREDAPTQAIVPNSPGQASGYCLLCNAPLGPPSGLNSDALVREIEGRIGLDTTRIDEILRLHGREKYQQLYLN